MGSGVKPLTDQDVLDTVEAAIMGQEPFEEISCDPYADSQIVRGFNNIMDLTLHGGSPLFSRLLHAGGKGRPAENIEISEEIKKSNLAELRGLVYGKQDNIGNESLYQLVCATLVERLSSILSINAEKIQRSQLPTRYGMDSLIAIE